MGAATVISMTVRPSKVSHLCFEVGGILGELNAVLGKPASLFDFVSFYGILEGFPTQPGNPPGPFRLHYGPSEIHNFVQPHTLATLRAEGTRAALYKAIYARQNAYFAKYGNIEGIVNRINELYSPSNTFPKSKPHRLDNLSTISDKIASDLENHYVTDGIANVVKHTHSVLESKTSGGGSRVTGQTAMESLTGIVQPITNLTPPAPGGVLPIALDLDPAGTVTNYFPSATLQAGSSGETVTNTGTILESQPITNTDYGYRHPFYEARAQNERAQISLMDQKFAQFMYSQNLPHLERVFENEKNSIDRDVYRLQIAYLNTILLSPIGGTVTGIYKNPGDPVKAGEPVIRVENDDSILLVATLRYSGPITINASVTIGTTLFGSTPLSPPITGSVVAVRGQGQENQWAVIVQCDNLDTAGKHIFPLGYQFDYDDTTVTIT
jgi:hypothetical protein